MLQLRTCAEVRAMGVFFRSAEKQPSVSFPPTDSTDGSCINTHRLGVCTVCVCALYMWQLTHTDLQTYRNSCGFLFSAFHSGFLSVHHEVTGYKLESPHSAAHVESYGIYRTYLYFAYALNLFSNICVLLQAVWIWSIVSAYSKTFLTAAVWKSCKYGGNIMTETEKNKNVN